MFSLSDISVKFFNSVFIVLISFPITLTCATKTRREINIVTYGIILFYYLNKYLKREIYIEFLLILKFLLKNPNKRKY